MRAVAEASESKAKDSDSDSEDSEEDIGDPEDLMPKHFDKEDAFFNNLSTISRSDSAASMEYDNAADLRPASACTDTSDTSGNNSFDLGVSGTGDTVDTEANFDASTLTCKLCNKVMKNMRTFRNHKARHLGTLNHKCPDCGKGFEGRSAVNRHLLTNHSRELQPHEITNNPAATPAVNTIKPSAPEIKLFKPSEMAKKVTKPAEVSPNTSLETQEPSVNPPALSPVPPRLEEAPKASQEKGAGPNLCQMPILLENPETEVRYIVGSQLRPSDGASGNVSERNSLDEDDHDDRIMDPDNNEFHEPLSASSPRRSEHSIEDKNSSETSVRQDAAEDGEKEKSVTEDEDKNANTSSKLPEKLANFERIIPESDDSDSDKSDSDSSSSSSDDLSSDSDSDDSFEEENKNKSLQPEEITLDDEDEESKNLLNKSDSSQYHNAFESFLNKSKDDSGSDIEEDPLEQKRKTRQSSRRIPSPDKAMSKVITMDPIDDAKLSSKTDKSKLVENTTDTTDGDLSLSDDDTSEDTQRAKAKLADRNKQSKPQPKKVSMVAAIFRAKKKKQSEVVNDVNEKNLKKKATRVLVPKATKKQNVSDSESDKERENQPEKISADAPLDKEAQDEADKLLEQKGVAVVGGKLMIPAHKLKIPDELCLIKTSGKGKGSKKMFICQICDNQVNRADKMKYHLFNEHYDDFIRCSDSVPKILAKNHSLQAVENKTSSNVEKDKPSPSVNKPSAIARIFAKKNKATSKPPAKIIESKSSQQKKPVEDLVENTTIDPPESIVSEDNDYPPMLSPHSSEDPQDVVKETPVRTIRGKRKSPRKSIEQELSIEGNVQDSVPVQHKKERNVRRSSPRGFKLDEDQLEGVKDRAIIAPPSIRLPNISLTSPVLASPKTSIFGQEPFSSNMDPSEIRSPFQSKSVHNIPREETSIGLLTTSNIFEPKFGSDKNLVSFADLAMKSKEQKQDPIMKPKGRPGRPKKVGRKKIAARVSVEQSNIEDTPNLLALQAAKEAEEEREKEEKERDEKEIIQKENDREEKERQQKEKDIVEDVKNQINTEKEIQLEQTTEKSEDKKSEETMDVDEDKKDDESRPTRSRLHVETIGLSSSTLDLELHALRNLVFKEILETEPENLSLHEIDKGEGVQDNEPVKDEAMEEESTQDADKGKESSSDDDDDYLPSRERFIRLGDRIISGSQGFACAIWHERKRLRLQKRKELQALMESISVEKRAKFKPKRYDFSLALLCSSNLYNNILVETEKTLQQLKETQYLIKHCSNLASRKQRLYSITSKKELKLSLKRLRHHKYSSRKEDDLRIVLTKRKPIQTAEDDEDTITPDYENNHLLEEPDTNKIIGADTSQPENIDTKAFDFRLKKNQRKTPPAKRMKVAKVTWGSVATPEENVVKKKRGRKPKIKPEVEKPKGKRGRKPKVTPTIEVKEENESSSCDHGKSDDTDNVTKAKRPRKGRPKKLTNEDVVKRQQLDIQVVKEEKPNERIDISQLDKCDAQNNHPLSVVAPENVLESEKNKDNIFDFDEEDNKSSIEGSSSTSYKDMNPESGTLESKKSDETVPIKKKKIKRCEFIDGSGDETQVPLKITFKRQSPEGTSCGKVRKSIKLRVKTQTTRDNGLKIQIKQPKTDNPLKFKVKAGSKENKKKKLRIKNLISNPSKETYETDISDQPSDASSSAEAQQNRESFSSSAGKYSFTPFKQTQTAVMMCSCI